MDFSEGSSSEILGRLSSAYGVETQKQLAEKLGVSAANVSNWVQRNSVPGSAFVRCALDTGCDLEWLATGKYANANLSLKRIKKKETQVKGKVLLKKMLATGGREVLQRILIAYGFRTQKDLSEYLEISTGTISTWVRRGYFPGDIVVTCALDTGSDLQWLATGESLSSTNVLEECNFLSVPRKDLIAGVLYDNGHWNIDLNLIPHELAKPILIFSNMVSWIVDTSLLEISNGRWLLCIDGKHDVYDVVLLPGRRINVVKSGNSFTCSIGEIMTKGKVIASIEYNF